MRKTKLKQISVKKLIESFEKSLKFEGDGTPGRCCDQFTCEKGEDTVSVDGKRCPYKGNIYEDGDQWHTSSCEQCKCKGGIALCSKMTCPSPSCSSFV